MKHLLPIFMAGYGEAHSAAGKTYLHQQMENRKEHAI